MAGYEAKSDWSLVGLIAANLVTIGLTFRYEFDLRELLLIYWLQSIAIGISFVIRMAFRVGADGSAFDFSSKGDRAFQVFFFVVHFGFFHFIYLVFLKPAPLPALVSPVGLCVGAFVVCHAYSLWHNIRRDRVAAVQFSTLFWLPYARIIPMHGTIILGGLVGSEHVLLLFLGLKTLADALMHWSSTASCAAVRPPDPREP